MDLPALETILASFPTEMLRSIGGNHYHSFSDPARRDAWATVLDWYSIDFLETVLTRGSDDAVYWALKKIRHQSINGPSIDEPENEATRRLIARKGVITDDVRARLVPALEKLRVAQSVRTKEEASEVIAWARAGLLLDRQQFLDSLRVSDEDALNGSLQKLMDTVTVNPQLTLEIWNVLARARSENLALTCLRYEWLFDLPAWDANKTRLLSRFLEQPGGGAVTNVNSALAQLALSDNPLAGQILAEVAATGNKLAKQRMAGHLELYREARLNRSPSADGKR